MSSSPHKFEYEKLQHPNWIKTAKSFATSTEGSIITQIFKSHDKQNPCQKFDFQESTKKPIILLEILNPKKMHFIIYFSYLLFILAIIYGFFEHTIGTKFIHFNNIKLISLANNNNNRIEFIESGNKYFYQLIFNQKISIKAEEINFYLYSNFIKSYKRRTHEKFKSKALIKISAISKQEKIDFTGNFYFSMLCYSNNYKCTDIKLIWPHDSPFGIYWQDKIVDLLKRDRLKNGDGVILSLKVYMANWLNLENFRVNYVFMKSSEKFAIFIIISELTLLLITITFSIFYYITIKISKRTVSEQFLICLLFIAILLFQIGVILISLPYKIIFIDLSNKRNLIKVIGSILLAISTNFLASYILFIANNVYKTSGNMSNTNIITTNKIIILIVNGIASILTIIISKNYEISLIDNKFSINSHLLKMLYIFILSLWGVITLVWFAWIFKLSWSAFQELSFWNFQATKFRQLSFRFVVTISWLIIVYMTIIWGCWLMSGYQLFGTYDTPLSGFGTYILLTMYTLFSGYVHLPAKNKSINDIDFKNKTNDNYGFSLKIARWMCDLSWQSYGIDPNQKLNKTIENSTFNICVKPFGLNLIKVGRSDKLDVQWFIASNKDNVILSFRGSISYSNVSTDLQIKRYTVDNNFWYTGDTKYINVKRKTKKSEISHIHSGFLNAYLAIRIEIINEIFKIIESKKIDRIFYLTGHSLGGALATICSLELKCRFNLDIRIYSFGSPRVGSKSFVNLFKNIIPRNLNFRIVFERDIATVYPAKMANYSHVDLEVYIDRAGNIIFSPSFVEKSIFPIKNKLDHHSLVYYRDAIDTACAQHKIAPRPSDNYFSTNLDAMLEDGI